MNKAVDQFVMNAKNWKAEFWFLRGVLLDCDLQEEFKWGKPCYTLNANNIVLIHGFKEYCALLFHKGALLSDPKNLLVQQTENVQGARQIRFTSLSEIINLESDLKNYIQNAIEVEKTGLKVALKPTSAYYVCKEFQEKLDSDAVLNGAFKALTPGRQRGYLLFFGQAKQAKTRIARIDKNIPNILKGKGLND